MAIPHIVLFVNQNCTGGHFHIFQTTANLDGIFNDVTSSFVILEGSWQFFADANFQGQMGAGGGRTLGPGVYNSIEASLGSGSNDKLSSLKSI